MRALARFLVLGGCLLLSVHAQAESIKTDLPEHPWGVGFRGGYTTIPNFILGGFFDKYVPVNGYFLEGVASRKFGSFTLYASLTATRATADKGIWQRGPTKTPSEVVIDLSFVSADAVFDWELRLHKRFAFHFGAGLGMGFLFGTLSSQDCNFIGGACVFIQGQPPKDQKAESGWPIYPVLHLVAGARIDLAEQWSLRVDFDFRNAFGVALGVFYEI
jgi:hypothetical protein